MASFGAQNFKKKKFFFFVDPKFSVVLQLLVLLVSGTASTGDQLAEVGVVALSGAA